MKGVSIIICCYNSSQRLPDTLRHIAMQVVPDNIQWELIIVNNASTDNTAQVAINEWNKYDSFVPCTIVEEFKPGLNFAREKGLEVSKCEYLLFCDDDNWLFPDYIKIVFEVLETNNQVGVLGGHGIAKCEIEPPIEIKPFLGAYATGPQASRSGDVTHTRTTVYGAGSVYRKSILIDLKEKGFKSYIADRKGDILTSGGDAEMCWAVSMAGYKIWYDERLKFYHFLTQNRLTLEYLIKMEYGNGYSSVLHIPYYHYISKSNRPAFKNTWWWRLMGGSFILALQKYQIIKGNSVNYNLLLAYARQKGHMMGLWKCRNEYTKLFKMLRLATWIKNK